MVFKLYTKKNSIPRCRICLASAEQQSFFQEKILKLGQSIFLCKKCSFVYLWPDLTTKSLNNFYSNTYRKIYPDQIPFKDQQNFLKLRRSYDIANSRYNFYKKWVKKSSKVFEIGSGFGCFLNELNVKGIKNIYAYEPDEKYKTIGIINNNDIHFIHNEKDKKLNNSFDVIFSFHVLEHIVNPISFILNCKKLLKKNGILIIEVPDLNLGFGSQKYFNTAHVSYFTKFSLTLLLSKNDFNILECGNIKNKLNSDSIYLIAKNNNINNKYMNTRLIKDLNSEINNNNKILNRFTWTYKDKIKHFIIVSIIVFFGPSFYGRLKIIYNFYLK